MSENKINLAKLTIMRMVAIALPDGADGEDLVSMTRAQLVEALTNLYLILS